MKTNEKIKSIFQSSRFFQVWLLYEEGLQFSIDYYLSSNSSTFVALVYRNQEVACVMPFKVIFR